MPLYFIDADEKAVVARVAEIEAAGEAVMSVTFQPGRRLDMPDRFVVATQARYATSPPRSYETRVGGIGGIGGTA